MTDKHQPTSTTHQLIIFPLQLQLMTCIDVGHCRDHFLTSYHQYRQHGQQLQLVDKNCFCSQTNKKAPRQTTKTLCVAEFLMLISSHVIGLH